MKKLYLLGCLLCWLPLTGFAQTEKQLENAVRIYNTVDESMGKPDAKPDDLLKLTDNAETLLKTVIQKGGTEEQRSAKYFWAVLEQMRAEVYYRKGDGTSVKKGGDLLKVLESEFDRLDESAFPLSYQYSGTAYTVVYKDFLPARQRYFGELAELYSNVSEEVNVRKYAQKALALQPEGYYYITFLVRNILYKMARTYPEKADQGRPIITLYSRLTPENRASLNKLNIGETVVKTVAPLFLVGQNASASWDKTGAESAVIAGEMRASNLDTLSGKFYGQAMDKGQVFSEIQSWDLLQYFDNQGFKLTGLKVANKILPQISADNCADLLRLATYFQKFGDGAKARSVQQSGEACASKVRKTAEAEQKRRERADRRENRGHVYLGAYILRITQRPEYIDLGGVLNIPIGRSMLEFSYLKARNDQDYLLSERFGNKENLDKFPNPHWDGFYAHIGYKKLESGRSKSRSYGGFLLSYNERNFQTQYSDVLDKTTSLPVANNVAFQPKVTSYGALLNFGDLWQKGLLGADFYVGVGASYNLFDLNNVPYSRENYDFSNRFLAVRKEAYWGLQLRVGMTLGFSL